MASDCSASCDSFVLHDFTERFHVRDTNTLFQTVSVSFRSFMPVPSTVSVSFSKFQKFYACTTHLFRLYQKVSDLHHTVSLPDCS